MKVAVIGANGQLGVDVCAAFRRAGDDVVELNHDTFDIADSAACRRVMHDVRPALAVNTAAMHHVEQCEQDPARAAAVNAEGPRHLALAGAELDCTLVHMSTDYVFDGAKRAPYVETDVPNPLNVYGRTKLEGERVVQSTAPKHFVVRTSALFGSAPCRAKHGLNFPLLMLKLARERPSVRVVDTEHTSPTYSLDVANALVRLVETRQYGLYHVVSRGGCTWFDFATRIYELTGTVTDLQRAGPDEFPAKVPRPAYSVLDTGRLAALGIVMPAWQDAIARYLATL